MSSQLYIGLVNLCGLGSELYAVRGAAKWTGETN